MTSTECKPPPDNAELAIFKKALEAEIKQWEEASRFNQHAKHTFVEDQRGGWRLIRRFPAGRDPYKSSHWADKRKLRSQAVPA